MPYLQRICAGLGGKSCPRRMSPLERDPHLLCPSCRGQNCSREVPCATCSTWTEEQWVKFDSRRAYKKRGGSTPVLGGGLAKVNTGAVEGGRDLEPLPQRPLQSLVPAGTVGLGLGHGAPYSYSLPVTSTAVTSSYSSTSHFYYGGIPSTTLPSHCHPPVMVTSAPVPSTIVVPSSSQPQPIIQFPPSPFDPSVPSTSWAPEYRLPMQERDFPSYNNLYYFQQQQQQQQQMQYQYQMQWYQNNIVWGPQSLPLPPAQQVYSNANPYQGGVPPPPPPEFANGFSGRVLEPSSNVIQPLLALPAPQGEGDGAPPHTSAAPVCEAAASPPLEHDRGPSLPSSGFSGFDPSTRGEERELVEVKIDPSFPSLQQPDDLDMEAVSSDSAEEDLLSRARRLLHGKKPLALQDVSLTSSAPSGVEPPASSPGGPCGCLEEALGSRASAPNSIELAEQARPPPLPVRRSKGERKEIPNLEPLASSPSRFASSPRSKSSSSSKKKTTKKGVSSSSSPCKDRNREEAHPSPSHLENLDSRTRERGSQDPRVSDGASRASSKKESRENLPLPPSSSPASARNSREGKGSSRASISKLEQPLGQEGTKDKTSRDSLEKKSSRDPNSKESEKARGASSKKSPAKLEPRERDSKPRSPKSPKGDKGEKSSMPNPSKKDSKSGAASSSTHPSRKEGKEDSLSYKDGIPRTPSVSDELEEDWEEEEEEFDYQTDSPSPEHAQPRVGSAVEESREEPETEESRQDFRRVIEMIRNSCGLEAPQPVLHPSRHTGIDKRFGAIPKSSIPLSLPISDMARECVRSVEEKIAGTIPTSLLSKGSCLFPSLSHQQEKLWYEFSDSSSSASKGIQSDLASLLGSKPVTLANKGAKLSAAELLVSESLAQSTVQAASWLDHWLVTVADQLGQEVSPEMRELLLSGGRAVRFICTQASSLWANSLLKRRDAALSETRLLSEEKNLLRNAPFFGSPDLIPSDLVAQVKTAREDKNQSAFLGNVAKLATKSLKAQSLQTAKQDAPSTSMKKRKRPGPPPPPKKSKGNQDSSSSQPPQKKGQTFRGGKGSSQGPKGRGKGKGAQ